jgi:hypothetical protein
MEKRNRNTEIKASRTPAFSRTKRGRFAQQLSKVESRYGELGEYQAQVYLYKNQGLYPNSGVNWGQRINMYGSAANINPDMIFRLLLSAKR